MAFGLPYEPEASVGKDEVDGPFIQDVYWELAGLSEPVMSG